MPCSVLQIHGLRGFATKQQVNFAVPDNETPGTGYTVLVGANNTGKSTITEALRALGSRTNPSISDGRRNKLAGDRVELRISTSNGETRIVRTVDAGGSETIICSDTSQVLEPHIFSLPSRRYFNPYFAKSMLDRPMYLQNDQLPSSRSHISENSAYRLFKALADRERFDAVLGKIVSPIPNWTIDQSEQGQYFVKVKSGQLFHSSEGMGEGLVSMLLVVDALYDSLPNDLIVIDEPELSLHPSLQRRLAAVIREYTRDRQIICATHSPHFVDMEAIAAGAGLARLSLDDDEGCHIHNLGEDSRRAIASFLANLNNPHILGLDAREVFFLQDQVILVEGQEDVVIYPRIAQQLDMPLKGEFYGWGIGGAENMGFFAQILAELGYKKVFGVLDGNRRDRVPELQKKFPQYQFSAIPATDVRSKSARPATNPVDGLTDSRGSLREEYSEETRRIFRKINEYFGTDPTPDARLSSRGGK